ncbi:MAG TPA: hypothetical protein VJV23_14660 [Candidatus Polarisedimenticolia bacterium]|nr:hypothetical protein [Candidatus Polarisedimenticolia bacterium]
MTTTHDPRAVAADPAAASTAGGRLQAIDERLDAWIEDARLRAAELRSIAASMGEAPEAPATAPAAAEARALEAVAALAREVESQTDQSAILGHLVAAAAGLADRVVLFVVKGASLKGWMASGLGAGADPRTVVLPLSSPTLLARAVAACDVIQEAAGDRDNEPLARALGAPADASMLAAPLWVKDRAAAVLYADTHGDASCLRGALTAMAGLAALGLEALPLRARFPRPIRAAAAAAPPPPDRLSSPSPPAPLPAPGGSASGQEPPRRETQDAAAREEARRFARLLVSEIVLYNGAEIAEGRRHKDLYDRLKDDIDRSRRMYQERIPPSLTAEADYFREEVVRSLAAGDESALGRQWG